MKIYLKDVLFIIVFAFVVINIYLFFESSDKAKETIKIVDSSTEYYDVIGIVDKYVSAINNLEEDKILLMLDDDFMKKHKIDKMNVFKNVKKFNNNRNTFSGDKMLYEKITDNITKYYVSGKIVSQFIDNETVANKYYLIVMIDNKNSTFSIIPDEGNKFREVEKNVF